MMKGHQTTKYHKQHKKERANRKARQLLQVVDDSRIPKPTTEAEEKAELDAMDRIIEATKPMSPARRAFQ